MMPILSGIAKNAAGEITLMNPSHLLCGFSGGADSTALLMFFRDTIRKFHPDIPLIALHANHGLRNAADDDEKWVSDFCRKYDISFISKRLHVPLNRFPGEGTEAAARRLRYAFFEEVAANYPNPVVVLGHHADDAIENFLIRLMRGGNLSSLMSPEKVTEIGRLRIYRPLLAVRRNMLEEELRVHKISWLEDETNAEPCCGRNVLRLQVLPVLYEAFPHGREGIYAALEVLRQDAALLNGLAEDALKACLLSSDELSVPKLARLHPALLQRVIRQYLEHCGSKEIPTKALMARISEHLALFSFDSDNDSFSRIPISGYESFRISPNSLKWFRQRESVDSIEFTVSNETLITYGHFKFTFRVLPAGGIPVSRLCASSHDTFYFDADVAGTMLTLRMAQSDDGFQSFGRDHASSLFKFARKSHILWEERQQMVVLESKKLDRILLSTGLRRSSHAPITDETQTVLEVSYQMIPWAERRSYGFRG